MAYSTKSTKYELCEGPFFMVIQNWSFPVESNFLKYFSLDSWSSELLTVLKVEVKLSEAAHTTRKRIVLCPSICHARQSTRSHQTQIVPSITLAFVGFPFPSTFAEVVQRRFVSVFVRGSPLHSVRQHRNDDLDSALVLSLSNTVLVPASLAGVAG